MQTPMMVPVCGHSFCSMCVRQYLESKGPTNGDCPSCRAKNVTPDGARRRRPPARVSPTVLLTARRAAVLVRNVKLMEVLEQFHALAAHLASAGPAAAAPAPSPRGAKRRRTSSAAADSAADAESDSDFEEEARPAVRSRRAESKPRASSPREPPPAERRSSRLRRAAEPSRPSSAGAAAAAPAETEEVIDLSGGGGEGGTASVRRRSSSADDRVICPIWCVCRRPPFLSATLSGFGRAAR